MEKAAASVEGAIQLTATEVKANHEYRDLYIEKHIFLEENIEIFKEINEDIVIEEEYEIKNSGGD